MPKIDGKDYIDEILANIRSRDSIKAKVLLRHIDDVDEGARRRLVFELSRTDDEYSLPLLASLASENPALAASMPALRQVLFAKFLSKPKALSPLMREGSPEARAFFASLAAEIKAPEFAGDMIAMLSEGSCSPELEASFMSALGDMACAESANIISERLNSESVSLSLAAAEVLGKIATPTALRRLSEAMGRNPELDAIAVGVFAKIQDELALKALNDGILSHSAAVRKLVKDSLIKIGSKAVPMLVDNLLRKDDPDLLIHSLNVLGEIGDICAVGPIRKLLESEPPDPNVRFAAYETLGSLHMDKGEYVLASGLADPVDNVCIAAAKAIDRNYNDILSAGVRNLMRAGGDDLRRIMTAVIDAEADRIFIDLMEDPVFSKFASAYLKNKAHSAVREHFRSLLAGRGMKSEAAALETQPSQAAPETQQRRCMVVDDSKMILSVYRTVLHALGWTPELFDAPAAAIQALKSGSAPYILITDLNMPGMTGIELSVEIRKIFTPAQLPILMVTTQNEPQDSEAAIKAGVGLVTHKPFTEDSLSAAIESVIRDSSANKG